MTDEPLDPRLGLGGNSPPPDLKLGQDLLDQLAANHADITARKDELLAAAERFLAAHAAIEDDELSGKTAGFLVQINSAIKTTNQTREAVKSPYLQGGREVDGFFNKGVIDPLTAAFTRINRLQTAYGVAKAERARREREEAARLQREKEAAAREAAEKAERERVAAERAAKRAKDDQAAADAAARAEAAALKATHAQEQAAEAAHAAAVQETAAAQPTAAMSRVRGDYATVSVRETWTYTVVNIALVPPEYLMVNDSMVRAAIRGKNGKREIPGLLITPQHAAVNR